MTIPGLTQDRIGVHPDDWKLTDDEEEMLAAAEDLRFEYAAQLRDELRELRRDLKLAEASEAPAGA